MNKRKLLRAMGRGALAKRLRRAAEALEGDETFEEAMNRTVDRYGAHWAYGPFQRVVDMKAKMQPELDAYREGVAKARRVMAGEDQWRLSR